MPHRIERVNHLIRQEISELVRLHMKDPRLSTFLSVNEVRTSADFRHARVYVSCISGTEHKEEMLAALAGAAGYLRRELANNIKLRRVPELTFIWDSSIEQGDRILNLIEQVTEDDAPNADRAAE